MPTTVTIGANTYDVYVSVAEVDTYKVYQTSGVELEVTTTSWVQVELFENLP